MGKRKHDWNKLKIEYVTGDFMDQRTFAAYTGIDYGYLRNMSCATNPKNNGKSWEEEKKEYLEERATEIRSRTLEMQAEKEADRNTQHLMAWDNFLKEVTRILADYTVTIGQAGVSIFALERLANIMDKLQRGQRLALGLDKETDDGKNSLGDLVRAIKDSATAVTFTPQEIQPESDQQPP